MEITFVVIGCPQQVGSKTAMALRGRGGALITRPNGSPVIAMTDSNKKSKGWMQATREAAAAACPEGFELLRGPIRVEVEFRFARPKSHFRTGKRAGELKDNAPYWHTGTPDEDKLCRALGDSLTGVVIADDKQICVWDASKIYTTGHEGMTVAVSELPACRPDGSAVESDPTPAGEIESSDRQMELV